MEKFKKRVSAILVIGIIAFVAGFAMLSQNLSHVSRVSAAENVASLSVDGTVTEYATVKDALDAIPAESEVETTIVKILQDTTVSLSNMSNKKFTLDLNGCKLTNTSQFLNNSEILFVDNSDSGTGEFYSHSQNSLDITNCNITIKSGKISADYNESSKKTYPSCTILSGSKVTVDGGRLEMSVKADVETGILIMNSGYIYEMFYQDSTFHNNVTLNGGNITKAKYTCRYMLAVDKANGNYKYFAKASDDTPVKISDIPDNTEEVTITEWCEHPSKNAGGQCEYCSYCEHKDFSFSGSCLGCSKYYVSTLTVNGTRYVHQSLADALNDIPADATAEDAKITILVSNKTSTSVKYEFPETVDNKNFTINLNSKNINVTSSAEDNGITFNNSNIIFSSSGTFNTSGKTTFSGCNVTFNRGTFPENGSNTFSFENSSVSINEMVSISAPVVFKPLSGENTFSMTDGTINSLTIDADCKGMNISGGTITTLTVNANAEKCLSGGTITSSIAFPAGVTADYRALLADGKAYKSSGKFVKIADMNSSTAVSIADCTHGSFADNGKCDYCNAVFAAKAKINGSTTEKGYLTLEEAIAAVSGTSVADNVITLLNDCAGVSLEMSGKNFTLDFNGHTITTSGAPTIADSTIIFDDFSVGQNGKLIVVGTTGFSRSTITFNAGTFARDNSGVYYFGSGGNTLIVDGGTITGNLNLQGANFIMKSGSVQTTANCKDSVNVDISGGTIDNLTVGGNIYGNNKSVSISGGEIKSLSVGFNYSYRNILANGKAYKSSGKFVKIADMNSSTAVQITDGCTHDSVTGSECDYCNAVLAAKAIIKGSTTEKGYETLGAALDDIPQNGNVAANVITLLNDCTDVGFDVLSKNFTFDFNGHTATAKGSASFSSSTVIFTDSSVGKVGGLIAPDKFAFGYGCNVTINAGIFEVTADEISSGIYNFSDSATVLVVNGGKIAKMNVQNTNSITLNGGTIASISVGTRDNGYNGMLGAGKAFKSAEGEFVKLSDMDESIAVTIENCEHGSYTGGVCDYCGTVCEHKDGEGNYTYVNGKCSVCGELCPHNHVTSAFVCEDCGLDMIVCVNGNGVIRYYSDILVAISALSDGDTLKLLQNVTDSGLAPTVVPTISKAVLLDLNGKSTGSVTWNIDAEVAVIDSVGGGRLGVRCLNGNIAVKDVKADTEITINVASDSVKATIYGGKILSVYFEPDCGVLKDLLPSGYAFKNESGELLKYADCGETSYAGGSGKWLTVVECSHSEDFDENLNCIHCGEKVDADQAIVLIKKRLEIAQKNLNAAIDGKADKTELEDAVKKLNAAIAAAETAAKDYAKEYADGLKTAIDGAIDTINNTIKDLQDGLKTAQENLAAAQEELAKKANSSDVTEEIKKVSAAIKAVEDRATALETALEALDGRVGANEDAIKLLQEADKEIKDSIATINDTIKDLQDGLKTAQDNLAAAKEELQDSIDKKADAKTVNDKLSELENAITAVEGRATALETALEALKGRV